MVWYAVARQHFQEAGGPDEPPTNLLTTEDYTQGPDQSLFSYANPETFNEALDAAEHFYVSGDGYDARIRTWVETTFVDEQAIIK